MTADPATDPTRSWILEATRLDLGLEDPRSHAVTMAETEDGLALAFFGGPHAGLLDQGIWFMRKRHGAWEKARRVAKPREATTICWNPVLNVLPDGTLLLFYKEGERCASWWGLLTRSYDGGDTWERAAPLPRGILGPIRNKAIAVADDTLLCGSSTEDGPWRVHFEHMRDAGASWSRTPSVHEGQPLGAIQPTILPWPSGRWQALCRSRAGCVVETFSVDGGHTWSSLVETPLPNPNAALDGIVLDDRRALIVFNPTLPGRFMHDHRSQLALGLTDDGGASWKQVALLEDEKEGEFSYPAVIRTEDGRVHVAYTTGEGWRGVKHVVIDPAQLPD